MADAGAVVLDLYEYEAVGGAGADDNYFVFGVAGVFDCVVEEVNDNLHDGVGVESEWVDMGEILFDDEAGAGSAGGHHINYVADAGVYVTDFEVVFFSTALDS